MDYFLVSEKTLYNRFNGWDERGLLSLYNRRGRGRKAKLTGEQEAQVKQWVEDSSRQLKPVIEKIKATLNISVSLYNLKRVLKAFKMGW